MRRSVCCARNGMLTYKVAVFRWQVNGPKISMKSILLVDDSRFMRLANERALARAGYRVLTASDGEEALRMAYEMIPDLILLDMLLPKLGGPEVLHALRENHLTASVPVIVLSSLPQTNEAKLVKEGATAYFEKSKLELDKHADALLHIVKIALDDPAAADIDGNSEPQPDR